MALPACGAPDGGTARESNLDLERKERSAGAELPTNPRTQRSPNADGASGM